LSFGSDEKGHAASVGGHSSAEVHIMSSKSHSARTPILTTKLQQGAVGTRTPLHNNSQAHTGVEALNPVTHRNVSFQPLPRAIGLPPYHYSLTDNFPKIASDIDTAKKMVFHVLGDSGGVQDGEFQNNVAKRMVSELNPNEPASPQFCYHVGDVVYFTVKGLVFLYQA
jgi:hypothetical protein